MPAPTCSACATPTAAACRRRSPPAIDAVRAAVPTPIGIHCHNDAELAVANSLIAGRARRRAGAGHDQRHRRALRQRQPVLGDRQPAAQDGLPRGRAPRACAGCGSCRASSTSSPTSSTTSGRPTSARARSRTRAACTSPRCSATRRPTSTSIRRWSATTSASWCPTSPGRANIVYKAKQFGVDLEKLDGHVRHLVDEVKQLEHQGYQFEGAEASLELRMHRVQHGAAALLRADPVPRRRREGLHAR